MNLMNVKVKVRFERIRKEYRKLKRGGYADAFRLKEEIKSFINVVSSKGEDYEGLREEAEDMLIDVTFMIEEGGCAPFRAKSIK